MQTPFVQIAGISLHSSISARRQTSLSILGEAAGRKASSVAVRLLPFFSLKRKGRKGPPRGAALGGLTLDPADHARLGLLCGGLGTPQSHTTLQVAGAPGVGGRASMARGGKDPAQAIHLVFSERVSAVAWTLAQALGPGCKWEVPRGSLRY